MDERGRRAMQGLAWKLQQIYGEITSGSGRANGNPDGKLGRSVHIQTLRREVEITNALGLHLRAADQFVRVLKQYEVEVKVFCKGHAADGGSILDLLSLAAELGPAWSSR